MKTLPLLAALLLAALPAPAQTYELAVYKGAGCEGAPRVAGFEAWLGRPVDRVVDFLARESWHTVVSSARWISGCWRDAGRRLALAVPLLPDGDGATLAAGAAGAHDRHFRAIAEALVADGHADAVIRLGWEFNGDWYPWAAAPDPDAWIANWRRVVRTMRAVPGARFRFEWSPALGRQRIAPDRVYPGDAYVDVIGLTVYNQSWNPSVTTPVDRWAELRDQPYGLSWHAHFAAARGKPVSFAEWGTGTRGDGPGRGAGGGDDPHFITRMADWIAARPVLYHGYWDFPAHDYNARLSDDSQPLSAAEFRRRFGD